MPESDILNQTLTENSSAPERPSRKSNQPSSAPKSARNAVNGSAKAADGELDRDALVLALNSFNRGDFSVRLPATWKGVNGRIADAFNAIAEKNASMSTELERISRVVGREGRINER